MLDVSLEKSRITNLKNNYSEFLGFKMKVIDELKMLIIKIQKVKHKKDEYKYVNLYNSTVWVYTIIISMILI